MASGPTASSIAMQTGVAQSVISSKTPEAKTTKEADRARQNIFGDEEEGSSKPGGKSETGGPGGANRAQQFQDGDKAKVKRKRVKLKDIAQRDVSKETGTKDTQQTDQAKAQAKARAQSQASQAKDIGYKKAAGVLMQQSRFTESSVKYEQACRARDNDQTNVLSPKGQQRWMLNNLISMTQICVEQHTGGKAGEAYESRRDNRLIHMALRGLRDGNQKSESSSSTSSTSRGISKGEYEAKQKKAQAILTNIIDPPVRPDHLPEYSEVA